MKKIYSMLPGKIYLKAMLRMSKNIFTKDTFSFRKAIPIADSKTVLKIAFPTSGFHLLFILCNTTYG